MRSNCFAAFASWRTSENRVFLPFLASTSLRPERLPRGPADNTQRLVSTTATQLIRGTPGKACDQSLVLRGKTAGRARAPRSPQPLLGPAWRTQPAGPPRLPRSQGSSPTLPVARLSGGRDTGLTRSRPYRKRPRDPQAAPQASRNPEGSRTPKLTEAPQSGCRTPRRRLRLARSCPSPEGRAPGPGAWGTRALRGLRPTTEPRPGGTGRWQRND